MVLGLALAACSVMLLLSFLDKWQCTGPVFDTFGISADFGRLKNSNLCYTDIQQLWIGRGVREHLFPYVSGRLTDGQLVGGAIEYPVLTGLFMWVTGLPAHNDAQFLATSALLLAPFGLVTTWLLVRLAGLRAMIWAAAPALVFYGFLNWDLLVTAAFTVAVWCWSRGRFTVAAAWLGAGTALKLYPALFVLPLVAARLVAGDRRGAGRVVLVSAGSYLMVNLPFILVNPTGWWATYEFQSMRGADVTTDSIWYWGFPHLGASTVNHLSATLIAMAWVVALAYGWWRARSEGDYPWVQVSAAMLCAFLLFNKVHSPQYMLWLLPFFVLVRVRWGWWLGYMVFDALLFVGLFQWYHAVLEGDGGLGFGPALQATVLGVWGRAGMLALLFVVFLRSPSVLRVARPSDQHSDQPSDPDGSPGATATDRASDRDAARGWSGLPGSSGSSRSSGSSGSSGPSNIPSSSTPPAGSSARRPRLAPVARTTSRSGARMSRTTSAQ